MQKITAKQCRTARSLLKWNLHDLANRVSKILPRRIDSFEHGLVHLMEWENSELISVFKKSGIIFRADLEVVLHKIEVESAPLQINNDNNGARIQLDNELNIISDSSAQKLPGAGGAGKEEEKRAGDKNNT